MVKPRRSCSNSDGSSSLKVRLYETTFDLMQLTKKVFNPFQSTVDSKSQRWMLFSLQEVAPCKTLRVLREPTQRGFMGTNHIFTFTFSYEFYGDCIWHSMNVTMVIVINDPEFRVVHSNLLLFTV